MRDSESSSGVERLMKLCGAREAALRRSEDRAAKLASAVLSKGWWLDSQGRTGLNSDTSTLMILRP